MYFYYITFHCASISGSEHLVSTHYHCSSRHHYITMLGTIRFVLVNIFISCELIYVADDYNACPFLLINQSGAKTVFAAIANSSVVAAVSLTNKFLEKPGDQCSDKERSPTEHSFQVFVIK